MDLILSGQIVNDNFRDEMVIQSVNICEAVDVEKIEFIIRGVYPTTKWQDTAISGIEFYLEGERVEVDTSRFSEYFEVVPE